MACLYIAFYYIRPTEWMPGMVGLSIFWLLGIFSVGVLLLNALSGTIKLLNSDSEKMMGGLIAAIIISHLSHGYIGGVIDSIDGFLPTMVGYFLMSCSISNLRRYNGFVLLLIALTTFLAYEGWLQYKTGFAHGGAAPLVIRMQALDGGITEMIRISWYGIFGDPNDLGLVLVMAVPFLVNMVFNKQFLLPVTCLPLVSFAIYHTNSRGSYLAFLSSLTAYFVIRYRNKTGAAIGLVLAVILFVLGPSRMEGIISSEDSAQGRLEAWYAGFQMLMSSPLFGVGQDRFLEYNYLTSHNSFVHVMAELGLFGLFFFTGLIYFPLNWLWRNLFQNQTLTLSKEDLGQISAVFSSLIGLLIAMFFLSRSYILVPYILFVLTAARTRLCVPVSGSFAPTLPPKQHYKNITISLVLLILFIKIITKAFLL